MRSSMDGYCQDFWLGVLSGLISFTINIGIMSIFEYGFSGTMESTYVMAVWIYIFVGIFVLGFALGVLYRRWGIAFPVVLNVTVLFLVGYATWLLIRDQGGAFGPSPYFMYLYYWPVVLSAVIVTGIIEHTLKRCVQIIANDVYE